MYSLKELVAAATECKKDLENVKTIQDVIDLRKVGISEKDIVSVDIGNDLEEILNLHELEPSTPVYGLCLGYYAYENVGIYSPVIYYGESVSFQFDVWERFTGTLDSHLAIEDTTLETIEDDYKKYVLENCIHISNIQWPLTDIKGLPDEMYIPNDVEDVEAYIGNIAGVCPVNYESEKQFRGGLALFDSHNGDSELNKYSGQFVEVIRPLTRDEADIDEVGKMYKVKFIDGVEADVFDDELSSDGMDASDEPMPYHLVRILRDEKIYELKEHLRMNEYADVEFIIELTYRMATLVIPESKFYEVMSIIEDRGIKHFVVTW